MAEDQPEESANVGKIICDFNKNAAKKAQKKENVLLSFAMKAVARDQDKNILISRLQRDLSQYKFELNESLDTVTLLKIQNEVKEDLLNIKDEELGELKAENKKLKMLLQQKPSEPEKITKNLLQPFEIQDYQYNNNENEVVSTFSNIIASPKNVVVTTLHDPVDSTTFHHHASFVEPAKPKSTKLKRSFKKGKDHPTKNIPQFIYNLRRRKPKNEE